VVRHNLALQVHTLLAAHDADEVAWHNAALQVGNRRQAKKTKQAGSTTEELIFTCVQADIWEAAPQWATRHALPITLSS